jgi:hypothetical protein
LDLRDLIVTPVLLILIFVVAYFLRPRFTDQVNAKYFIPALAVKIIGALAVGFIYQFYYRGGDTFAFHSHGSRHIWEAIMNSPIDGFRVWFSNGEYGPGLWEASEKIWFWRDDSSFFVIQVAAFFDLFTFSSYSATSICFALISFIGGWLLFLTFYNSFKEFHAGVAFATLFIPSVTFWGSGIFKDTLTLAGVGIATYCFKRIFISRQLHVLSFIFLYVSFWTIFQLKVYVLICLIPSFFFWWFASRFSNVQSPALRLMIAPFIVATAVVFAFVAVSKVVENDPRYNLSKISETARITAYDIRYGWGARTGEGSGYTLGNLDGTWESMFRLAPAAVNVSLFRPYPWEVRNPLMALSALESFSLFVLTLLLLFRIRGSVLRYVMQPEVLFCLTFSLIFAFAVGVSTSNFGTLSRYKIPMMPFYALLLVVIHAYWKRDKKISELAFTE